MVYLIKCFENLYIMLNTVMKNPGLGAGVFGLRKLELEVDFAQSRETLRSGRLMIE
jgi:hypothetical protein